MRITFLGIAALIAVAVLVFVLWKPQPPQKDGNHAS